MLLLTLESPGVIPALRKQEYIAWVAVFNWKNGNSSNKQGTRTSSLMESYLGRLYTKCEINSCSSLLFFVVIIFPFPQKDKAGKGARVKKSSMEIGTMGAKRKNQPGYIQAKDSRGRTTWVRDGSQKKTSTDGTKNSATADFAPSNSASPEPGQECMDTFNDAFEAIGQDKLAGRIQEESVVVSPDGNITSGKLDGVVSIQATSGNDYPVESVHVIDSTDVDRGKLVEQLSESFESISVKKPRKNTKPSDVRGRAKRLVITPDRGYVIDAGAWDSPFGTITTSSTINLDDDYMMRKGDLRNHPENFTTAELMAEEIAEAIGEDSI